MVMQSWLSEANRGTKSAHYMIFVNFSKANVLTITVISPGISSTGIATLFPKA